MKTTLFTLLIIAVIAVVGAGIAVSLKDCVVCPSEGNLGGFGTYNATSTWTIADETLTSGSVLKSQSGKLSSIMVSKAGTAGGVSVFYDASSAKNLGLDTISTTSARIFTMPNDLAAGSYNLDIAFNRGLYYEYDGTTGTSTIIWE